MRGGGALPAGPASRELRLFMAARTAASLARWAFTIVLAIAAYEAGGARAVALAAIARVLPGAIAAPAAAGLTTGRSPRSAALLFTAGATALLAALVAAAALGAPLALVLALAAGFSGLVAAQGPALAAVLPTLVRSPRELASTQALRQTTAKAAYGIGALAGGAAAAGLSVAAGFGVALAASAAALLALAATPAGERTVDRTPRARGGAGSELLLAAREVRAAPDLRDAVASLATVAFVYGLLEVLVVVVAIELVGLGTVGVGVLHSAWGAGGVAGSLAALALLSRRRFSTSLDASAACIALPLALLAAVAEPAVAIVAFGVLGVGWAIADGAARTLLQRLPSAGSLARVGSLADASSRIAVALGALTAPLLIGASNIRGALLATALIVPVVVIARWRATQRLDARAAVRERELAALQAVGLLASLATATLETLALHATPRLVFAGEQILRLGDTGSRLYVIADGTFEVQAGPITRRLGPGDHLGEIALLRDVPATAAVAAETDGLLYGLERAAFLAAVT